MPDSSCLLNKATARGNVFRLGHAPINRLQSRDKATAPGTYRPSNLSKHPTDFCRLQQTIQQGCRTWYCIQKQVIHMSTHTPLTKTWPTLTESSPARPLSWHMQAYLCTCHSTPVGSSSSYDKATSPAWLYYNKHTAGHVVHLSAYILTLSGTFRLFKGSHWCFHAPPFFPWKIDVGLNSRECDGNFQQLKPLILGAIKWWLTLLLLSTFSVHSNVAPLQLTSFSHGTWPQI